MTLTKAYVLQDKGAPFELQEVHLAEPEANEVLVEITASGLCHTDLAIQSGAFPSPFPNVTGHEGSGKVVKIGSAVTRVQPGDSVLLSFNYCSACGPCKMDEPSACEKFGEVNFGRARNDAIGSKAGIKSADGQEIYGAFFGQSSFAQMAIVGENSVVKVPSDTDLIALAPLGCGLQTGAGAILNLLKPAKSTSISIFGLGAVGAGALFAAKYLGVETIIVVDLLDEKLKLAKELGATHTFNAKEDSIVKKMKELTKFGMGTTYSVECSGNTRALMTAWEALANKGHLVSCGTPGPGTPLPFGIFENLLASKTYTGLTEGGSNPPEFIPKLIQLYNEGLFPVEKISKTFAVDKLDDAIHAMHTGKTIKPIIVFNEDA
ncbi:NAD(P)-dependent alcohol dehydrogenase [Sporobolomyces koalae]|uniref:NAD(P)-dependent alcohol dehydrogenase n=1 Tax=Sporobolomyces koalae TaxID=500713 RepID=UPI003179DF27